MCAAALGFLGYEGLERSKLENTGFGLPPKSRGLLRMTTKCFQKLIKQQNLGDDAFRPNPPCIADQLAAVLLQVCLLLFNFHASEYAREPCLVNAVAAHHHRTITGCTSCFVLSPRALVLDVEVNIEYVLTYSVYMLKMRSYHSMKPP